MLLLNLLALTSVEQISLTRAAEQLCPKRADVVLEQIKPLNEEQQLYVINLCTLYTKGRLDLIKELDAEIAKESMK